MKLTIKELKTLMNDLCTATPLFKKLQKELCRKQSNKEIKLAKDKMKAADIAFNSINDMFCFKEGNLSELVNEDRYVHMLTFEKGELINYEFKKVN